MNKFLSTTGTIICTLCAGFAVGNAIQDVRIYFLQKKLTKRKLEELNLYKEMVKNELGEA